MSAPSAELPGPATVLPVAETTPPPPSSTFVTYVNAFHHYSIAYPSNWYLQPAQSSQSAVEISDIDLAIWAPKRFKLDVVVWPNPQGQPLQVYLDDALAMSSMSGPKYSIASQQVAIVGGETGIEQHIVLSASGETGVWTVVSHEGRIFIFNSQDRPAIDTIRRAMLKSVLFTK